MDELTNPYAFGAGSRPPELAGRDEPLRSKRIKKGMIYSPQHGDAAFAVPLFDQFMKRVVPNLPKRRISTKADRSERNA